MTEAKPGLTPTQFAENAFGPLAMALFKHILYLKSNESAVKQVLRRDVTSRDFIQAAMEELGYRLLTINEITEEEMVPFFLIEISHVQVGTHRSWDAVSALVNNRYQFGSALIRCCLPEGSSAEDLLQVRTISRYSVKPDCTITSKTYFDLDEVFTIAILAAMSEEPTRRKDS